MPRKRSACKRCVAIKSSCNSGKPCSRCERLSLPCSYSDSPSPSPAHPSPDSSEGPKRRAKHKRSITGCISCVKRRKKCDETLPICENCRRLGTPCIPRLGSSSSQQAPARSQTSLQHILGVVGSDNRDESSDQALKYSTVSRSYQDWVALIEDNVPEPVRRGNLHESNALARKRKSRVLQPVLTYTALENLTGLTAETLQDWPDFEQYLLNHFIQVVARGLVVVNDDQNPFLLDILPMALAHKSVRHALLALASCHVRNVYPDFEEQVLSQKSQALHGLKLEIEGEVASEGILATTLILCLLEVCEGNSQKWILHLHGANALIKAMPIDVVSRQVPKFLFELYNFLCCIATITSDKAPAIACDSSNWTILVYGEGHRAKINPIVGVAQDVYVSLYHINELANQRGTRYETSESNESFINRANELEIFLHSWSLLPQDGERDWVLYEAISTANAIRWAALLRLYLLIYGNDIPHSKVQSSVIEILRAVSNIRPGSTFDARLLFPLFMAGIASNTKANRLTIEYRLSVIERTIGLGNITVVHELLDTLWRRTNDGEENIDWEGFIQMNLPGLVLF